MVLRVLPKVCAFAAVLVMAGSALVGAQTSVSDLKLNLKGDKPMTEAVSPLGEFRISLDSQMINGGDRFTLPS
ncbi:MAG: hypothetical protein HQM09_12205, partial [Candidatus Riflebacteria bacterium]|nr:hypothetical protein [Candidatus Riflebacteria bacterium]